jgi:type IV pilus assembly protein PilX
MLTREITPRVCGAPRRRQSGVVLMMALIVLVAMTLAGIALVRSVDTSNIIAGNLAFKQAATNSGDIGIETAVAWLQANNSGTNLHNPIAAQGYAAARQDPDQASGQTWDAFWYAVLKPAGVITLAPDAAGNTVAYTIQRLCNGTGDPVSGIDCAQPQGIQAGLSSSRTAGTVALLYNSQIFYRITSRIAGPRNTVSYVQVIVAL